MGFSISGHQIPLNGQDPETVYKKEPQHTGPYIDIFRYIDDEERCCRLDAMHADESPK